MNELKRRRPLWERLPFGLLGMLMLVIAVEAAARSRLDFISDWLSFTWRYAGQSVPGPASKAEVVFLGDSLIKGGVLPTVIEPRLRTPVYNLSIQGGTAATSYFLLKRLVGSGARPRWVVVDFHPNLLAVAPRSTESWADLLSLGESVDLLWQSADPFLFLRTCFQQALPSYRHRTQLRAAILAACRGEIAYAKRYNDLLRLTYDRYGGAMMMPVQEQVVALDPHFQANPRHSIWKPHRAQAAYVEKLLKLAEANHIRVALLLPPTSPEWLSRRRAMSAEASYEAYLKGLLAKFPGAIVVDGRDANYPNSAFKDLTHVHIGGASELSLGLAAILRPLLRGETGRELTSERWLALPRYQGQAIDPGLEVFDEAQLSLRPVNDAIRR